MHHLSHTVHHCHLAEAGGQAEADVIRRWCVAQPEQRGRRQLVSSKPNGKPFVLYTNSPAPDLDRLTAAAAAAAACAAEIPRHGSAVGGGGGRG